jgi:hypothetical protein
MGDTADGSWGSRELGGFIRREEARNWEERVRKLEAQGLTRSDAQAVVDAEDQKESGEK